MDKAQVGKLRCLSCGFERVTALLALLLFQEVPCGGAEPDAGAGLATGSSVKAEAKSGAKGNDLMSDYPMSGVVPPLTLPSNIIYFFDWRYVSHGYLGWLTPDNKRVSMQPAPTPLPPMHADPGTLPTQVPPLPKGIRIETIPGKLEAQPMLCATDLNEAIFFGGSVVRDGSGYRMYYESLRPDGGKEARAEYSDKVVRLLESADGFTWHKPELGLIEVAGSKQNNVVFDPGWTGCEGICVFRDDYGPAEERYKAVYHGLINETEAARYLERWPGDVDPKGLYKYGERMKMRERMSLGLRGAVSPDGLRWRMLEDPLLIQYSDTAQACAYDPIIKKYVLYPRTWYFDRRSVGRAVSDDFRHFTHLQIVLWPDPGMRPTDTWYTPGYTIMPGAPDYHLLMATLWSQVDDTFLPVLHASAEGALWYRVPGRPLIELGPAGSWYACGGSAGPLIELPGDRLGSLISGWHVPHKHPRVLPGFGQCGWATWQRGRLAALRADEDAEFSLLPLYLTGRKMILNCRTKMAGHIKVGVFDKDWTRTLDSCDLITGDYLDKVVTWGGEADMKHAEGDAVHISIQMRAADLYSIRFE